MGKIAVFFAICLFALVVNANARLFRYMWHWNSLKTTKERDPCNDNVIAYYKFDRSYRDVCFGNNGFGEKQGYFGEVLHEYGISDRAVHFAAGSNNAISIPSLNGYEWGSKFSVGFWFQVADSYEWVKSGGLIENDSNTTRGSWGMFIKIGETTKDVFIGAIIETSNGNKTWDHIAEVRRKHWFHLVMTYDGITVNFYLNSRLKISDSECCHGNIVSRNNDVVIGKNYKDGAFAGNIDELKLFKIALTAQEVTDLYQLKNV